MRKTKILALVLCVSIMLMGAGYAYWSDNLTINSTAATGEFNVAFTASQTSLYPFIMSADTSGEDYVDAKINPNALQLIARGGITDELTVTVGNMYPGAMALYAVKAENLGTIPAVFDYAEVILDGDSFNSNLLRQNLVVAGGFIQYNAQNVPTGNLGWFGIKDDGNTVKLGELKTYLDNLLSGLTLQPGDYILFNIPESAKDSIADVIEVYSPIVPNCIVYYLPTTVNNDLQNQSEQFTIKLHFKQHNAPLTNP